MSLYVSSVYSDELYHTGIKGMRWGKRKVANQTSKRPSLKQKMKSMTNEELQAYNTRKQLENTYIGYLPKAQISNGKKFVNSMNNGIIKPVAYDIGKAYLRKVIKDRLGINAASIK